MYLLLEIPFGSRRGVKAMASAFSDHQTKLDSLTVIKNVSDFRAPLLKKFHLNSIGVDAKQFMSDITPTFAALPFDHYDVAIRKTHFVSQHLAADSPLQTTMSEIARNPFDSLSTLKLSEVARALGSDLFQQFKEIDPVRMRSIATLDVALDGNSQVTILRKPSGPFIQTGLPKGDLRGYERHFEETATEVTEHQAFRKIIEYLARGIDADISPQSQNGRSFRMTLHQMCFLARSAAPFILPDGIHQDGADYILSALPIILDGVVPPVSTIYNLGKQPIYQTTLLEGEGLFIDDKAHWHGISEIRATGTDVGRRGILGIDIFVD